MTNFQAVDTSRQRLITPERAVLVLPVLAGVVGACLLLLFGLSPLLVQVQQRKGAVEEMQTKQNDLPLLKLRLVRLLEKQRAAQAQQERLFQLVAGTDALNTWLTQVNRFATQQGLAIVSVEPQPIERYRPPAPPPQAGGSATLPDTNTPPPPPVDPLLAANIEKHSALFIVQGPFPRLVRFLQLLEQLQVIVLASDVELEAVTPATTSTAPTDPLAAPAIPQAKLKLRLSAYGRTPAVAATRP
jgi:hypothetical protein